MVKMDYGLIIQGVHNNEIILSQNSLYTHKQNHCN